MSFSPYDAQLIPACIPEEWDHCDECGASEENDFITYWPEADECMCRKCYSHMTRFCRRCGERDWIANLDDEGVCDTCNSKAAAPTHWEDQLTDESLRR